jgi:large subunit ribosomal protein L13
MTTKTFRLSGHAIERQWHVLDAQGRPLGRVASEAAQLLLGKHKPNYEPHLVMGDHVIVINAAGVDLTGAKREQKTYFRHTGYPGGLRERSFEEQMERDPRRVIERAVKGMLPHNARGRQLFRALKVYVGADHPHEAQLKAGTGARARRRANVATNAPTTTVDPDVVAPIVPGEVAETVGAISEAAVPVVEAETPAHVEEAHGERLTGSLERYRRDELEQEAARLGIEIEEGWNKPDIAAAIQEHYDTNPVEE